MAAVFSEDRQNQEFTKSEQSNRPHIVVIGSGFAGFRFIKRLNPGNYDVTIISPRNHFLFTPLLPSTTVGTLEFRSIIEPVRSSASNVKYLKASCEDIVTQLKSIRCKDSLTGEVYSVPYDYLLIACGAVNNTFGIPGVEEHCHFLKDLSDARKLRQSIIHLLEQANSPLLSKVERRALLHFAIVGGGPTGTEFAAELYDFVKNDASKHYKELVDDIRITIFEGSSKILGAFDEKLSSFAMKSFRKKKIMVRTDARVKEVGKQNILLDNGVDVPCGMIVWSTGIGPVDFVKKSSLPLNTRGRIVTDRYLRVRGYDGIYAIGDCAVTDEQELPATAQVAQQQGKYLADVMNRRSVGKLAQKKFVFKNLGKLAYIGQNQALAELPNVSWSGFSAWLFWRSVYLTKLVSIKNRFLVVFDWIKVKIFGRDIGGF